MRPLLDFSSSSVGCRANKGSETLMYGFTIFITAMMSAMSALAQANTTPNQTDASTGGILYGLGALVAAAVIGGVVYMFIRRSKGRA
jgi:ABC-type transport system involved in multi-copper enzyme maturation permease subunit